VEELLEAAVRILNAIPTETLISSASNVKAEFIRISLSMNDHNTFLLSGPNHWECVICFPHVSLHCDI
jgi:hypothetical protein